MYTRTRRSVKLWDLNACRSNGGRGKAAADARELRSAFPNTGGIWAMHEMHGRVVTASKDKTSAVLSLGQASLDVLGRYSPGLGDLRTARWRDKDVFACGGSQSNSFALVDTRIASGSSGAMSVRSAGCVVFTLRWSPRDDFLLLCVGNDDTLRLHDVRSPKGALIEMTGHTRRGHISKKIYTPTFSHGGAAITTVGHGSNKLTVFSVADGSRVSAGLLLDDDGASGRRPLDAGATLQAVQHGDEDEVLVLAHGYERGAKRLEAHVASQSSRAA